MDKIISNKNELKEITNKLSSDLQRINSENIIQSSFKGHTNLDGYKDMFELGEEIDRLVDSLINNLNEDLDHLYTVGETIDGMDKDLGNKIV